MKGGLVVLLAALQAFEQTPGASALGWEVLVTPDEETGSHGSAPLFIDAATRHRFALVFEPARPSGDLVRSRMGTGSITASTGSMPHPVGSITAGPGWRTGAAPARPPAPSRRRR